MLLQVPRHCHKHKESSAGKTRGCVLAGGAGVLGPVVSHSPGFLVGGLFPIRVRDVWRKGTRGVRWTRPQMTFGQEELK